MLRTLIMPEGENLNREQTCKGGSVNVMYIVQRSSIAQLAADERGKLELEVHKWWLGGRGLDHEMNNKGTVSNCHHISTLRTKFYPFVG